MDTKHQPTCSVVPRGKTYTGKQAFSYFAGISAENTGSRGICMHLLIIPPGERAKAHLHERHETAIYVVSGEGGMWYGEGLSVFPLKVATLTGGISAGTGSLDHLLLGKQGS
jgi:uncharacterized RmlC-like cupin family protein